jgi:four helix bundle protein
MQYYGNLRVWKKAHAVVLKIYATTHRFPPEERFGLASQLRRSAASVAANIAEGCGTGSDPAFRHFVEFACSSSTEANYQLLLAKDLGYIDDDTYAELSRDVDDVRRMLSSLRRALKRQQSLPPSSRDIPRPNN